MRTEPLSLLAFLLPFLAHGMVLRPSDVEPEFVEASLLDESEEPGFLEATSDELEFLEADVQEPVPFLGEAQAGGSALETAAHLAEPRSAVALDLCPHHTFEPAYFLCGAHKKKPRGVILDDHECYRQKGSQISDDKFSNIPHTPEQVQLWLSWADGIDHPALARVVGWMRAQPPWSRDLRVSSDGELWYFGDWNVRPAHTRSSICNGFVSTALDIEPAYPMWMHSGGQIGDEAMFANSFATGGGEDGSMSANNLISQFKREPGYAEKKYKNTEQRFEVVPWEDVQTGDVAWFFGHIMLVVSKVTVRGEERVRIWHQSSGVNGVEVARQATHPDSETAHSGYKLSWRRNVFFLRKIPFDMEYHVELLLQQYGDLALFSEEELPVQRHQKPDNLLNTMLDRTFKAFSAKRPQVGLCNQRERDALIKKLKERGVLQRIAAAAAALGQDERPAIAARGDPCAAFDGVANSAGQCCAASCGVCGGSGCGGRPGGGKRCCTGKIPKTHCSADRKAPCTLPRGM